jgi:ankyrin repeat protein
MNYMLTLKYMTRLIVIALVALCVPASLCQASVEPELTLAIRQKNVPKVQQLLAGGANVNERDEGDEQTPLMWAVQVKDAALVRILLERGAAVNVQDDFGKTALMFAAEKDDADIIKLLLRHGADVSARTVKGATAADLARAHGHIPAAKLPAHSQQIALSRPGRSYSNHLNRVVALP